jgi:hypothetical protein
MAVNQQNNNENLTISLLDAKGKPLTWGRGKESISKVTVATGDSCRATEPCPQTFELGRGDVELDLTVPTGKMVRIDLEVTYGPAGTPQKLAPILTTLECGADAETMDILVPGQTSPDPAEETATLLIRGHLCRRGGCEKVEHALPVPIEEVIVATKWVTVNRRTVPAGPNTPTPDVVRKDGVAFLSLEVGSTYQIDVRSRNKCGQTCYGLIPPLYTVQKAGDATLDVCFEPQERMVALFFVDSCGQPASPSDVYRLDDGSPLDIDDNGRSQVPAQGRLRLASLSYELRPSELHLEDGSAAHVIHAQQLAGSKALKSGLEECLFVFENLGRDSAAIVQVTNLKGELVDTLKADAQGQISYTPKNPNETLEYAAYIDGKYHETVKMKAAKN